VNGEHFRAFLWLRWRLRVNQFRKAGTGNVVLFAVFVVLAAGASVGLFAAGFAVGFFALPGATPVVQLFMWDGIVIVFLFFWMIGLLTDLQRTEGLALDKVLHLPVSPTGAFLINYLSSLFSLTLIAFVPGMIGLILGQAAARSYTVLLALPLLAAFVLALTALTYQFQGWLASLMSNPRRRRTVIVVLTAGFIILTQLPNLVNLARPWDDGKPNEEATRIKEQRASDRAELNAKKITPEEHDRREKEIEAKLEEREREKLARAERIARLVSWVLPPGWLALGAADLASGAVLPALLGTLGFGLIGAASLWRAYRTTIRLYTGAFTGSNKHRVVQPSSTAPKHPADPNRVRFLEWRLPRVSEHASAVALAAYRSLMRAPEAKMALVAPLLVLVILLGSVLAAKGGVSDQLRPLLALGTGAMVMILAGVHLVGNQFGYERAGFRAYVLAPIPRREILLGKNLAMAPLGLGMGLAVVLVTGAVYPMRVDHYPTTAVLLVAAYLLFCLLANALSILSPIHMAAGSLQPSQVKLIPVLLQLVFMMVLPLVLAPVLMPFGVEMLLAERAEIRNAPVALVLALLLLIGVAVLYRWVLTLEGEWLAAREQAILDVVTGKE
jgi:hypothetical protein